MSNLAWIVVALASPAGPTAGQPADAAADPPIRADLPLVRDCGGSEEEIVVCGSTRRSPYRLPIQPEGFDPHGNALSVSAERHSLYEMGASGIGSCSTVGPGGWTGCDLIKWKRAYEQGAVKD